jgi:hypothetical protein
MKFVLTDRVGVRLFEYWASKSLTQKVVALGVIA